MDFSYLTIYNLMSYHQEYNEQANFEIYCLYWEDSESDNRVIQNVYRSYL